MSEKKEPDSINSKQPLLKKIIKVEKMVNYLTHHVLTDEKGDFVVIGEILDKIDELKKSASQIDLSEVASEIDLSEVACHIYRACISWCIFLD